MEPIRFNLATFEYIERRFVFLIAASAALLFIISSLNFNLFLTNRKKIKTYTNKVLQIESNLEEKAALEKKLMDEIGIEEAEKIMNSTVIANRLIAEDIFPWSFLFTSLEEKVPEGVMIQGFTASKNFDNLILKGTAVSEKKATLFLKSLKSWDLMQNSILTEFSIGSESSEKSGVKFTVKCEFLVEKLFEKIKYGEIGKSLAFHKDLKIK